MQLLKKYYLIYTGLFRESSVVLLASSVSAHSAHLL
jgi:hypothetical protein